MRWNDSARHHPCPASHAEVRDGRSQKYSTHLHVPAFPKTDGLKLGLIIMMVMLMVMLMAMMMMIIRQLVIQNGFLNPRCTKSGPKELDIAFKKRAIQIKNAPPRNSAKKLGGVPFLGWAMPRAKVGI